MEDYIHNNPLGFGKGLYRKLIDEECWDSIYGSLYHIVKELAEDQGIKMTDIRFLDYGAYSTVYEIGDKVLKIGKRRRTYTMPNDKRILKPLIRVDLGPLTDYKIAGTIEVVNKVKTGVNLSDEEVYQIWKELRSRGIYWADAKSSNLGILLKDNDYNTNIKLSGESNSRGLIGDNDDVLKAGEIVIIDSDYIYDAKELEEDGMYRDLDFDERYKKANGIGHNK